MNPKSWLLFVVVAIVLQCAFAVETPYVNPNLRDSPSRSALFEYINKPDASYRYERKTWSSRFAGGKAYLLNMTSQTWLTVNEVVNPVWWHSMVVVIPDQIQDYQTAFLYIGDGNNDQTQNFDNDPDVEMLKRMSLATGTVAAMVMQIPNQPTVFQDDPFKADKYEDALIAWTWRQVLESTNKTENCALLPMTKASVRAMDTVTAFSKEINPLSQIDKFVLYGKSKRGWTAWMAAAVDKRVVAIIPAVFDMLNTRQVLGYNYRSLGGWTIFFQDYFFQSLPTYLDTPQFQILANLVDPYVYRDLLTMPKYIVKTTGDEFFLLDNTYQYYNDLRGENYIRNMPNENHFLLDTVIDDIVSFYSSIVKGYTRPIVTWTFHYTPTGGEIVMNTNVKPSSVDVVSALSLSNQRRDFRANIFMAAPPFYQAQDIQWTSSRITGTNYRASFNNPINFWQAFYISASYPMPDNTVFKVSTEVMILPNMYPFQDCSGVACQSVLVKKRGLDQEA